MSIRKNDRLLGIFSVSLCVIAVILLTSFPAIGIAGIKESLNICYNTIIPSLFPFMLLCSCISSLSTHLLRRSSFITIALAITFGFVGGFPVGAVMLDRLVKNGDLSKKRAALLLCGCVNAGPAFLISGIGISCFNNPFVGVIMLISLCFASLICMFFALVFFNSDSIKPIKVASNAIKFSFNDAIRQTISSISMLCAYVIFFGCINAYVQQLLSIIDAEHFIRWLASASLEVTGGCVAAAGISGSAGAILACAAVSICGASIVLQIKSLCQPSGITLKYFLLSRPAHCIISTIMMKLLLSRFESSVAVFAASQSPITKLFCISPLFSLVAFLLCTTALIGERKKLGLFPR